jgi:hypothetical protein
MKGIACAMNVAMSTSFGSDDDANTLSRPLCSGAG